ncbi:MAG: tetratricopeptide repeat protein [Candidatus Eisenbacteria bacterium]
MKRPAVALAALGLLALLPTLAASHEGHSRATPALELLAAAPKVVAAENKAVATVDSLGLLERTVARDSTKFDNLYRLGVMLMDRDRSADAVKVLTKAVTLRPKDLRTLVNLGAAYDALGQADPAQNYYREALKTAPGDSVATCRLASSLYASSKTAESMDLLRKVIRAKPGSYCAYFTLGVAFADAGIYSDAIRMWKKVIALAPQSPEAISASESIEVLERYVKTN